MDHQRAHSEMLAYMERRGASAAQCDEWQAVAATTFLCPACFLEGRRSPVALTPSKRGMEGATCVDRGCRFVWSAGP